MKQTRDLLKNSGSTQAMRFIQSFSDSELDASNPKDWQKANQMGTELARKIAPDNQFAIYTHIDGNGHKLHNHLVMNMPDLKTGKKYNHDNDWQRVSKLNDEVIKSHGLTPLDPTRSKQVEKKTMAERQLQAKNEYVWKDDLRNRIDKVMTKKTGAYIWSKKSFSDVLKQSGIIYQERGKNACTYKFEDKNGKLRKIRGKNLGNDYTKEAIEHGLESNNWSQTKLLEMSKLLKQSDQKNENLTNSIETYKDKILELETQLEEASDNITLLQHELKKRTQQRKNLITLFNNSVPKLNDLIAKSQSLSTDTLINSENKLKELENNIDEPLESEESEKELIDSNRELTKKINSLLTEARELSR